MIIYFHFKIKVSKKEYDECRLNNIHQKVPILKCDRPNENVKYTLYISNFSPVPGAIEFTPGLSYYFISTSDGSINGLQNSEGGTCKTHNMKIVIKVLESQTHITTKQSEYHNYGKFTKNVKINSEKFSSKDLNTKKHNSFSMKILSSFVESLSTSKSFMSSRTTISTTQMSKTVDDNIFLLEPETIDYNDILSQLISESANNSNALDKKILHESFVSEQLNNGHSCFLINFSFNIYIFFLIYTIICVLFKV